MKEALIAFLIYSLIAIGTVLYVLVIVSMVLKILELV